MHLQRFPFHLIFGGNRNQIPTRFGSNAMLLIP